jgi:hypothetical protein
MSLVIGQAGRQGETERRELLRPCYRPVLKLHGYTRGCSRARMTRPSDSAEGLIRAQIAGEPGEIRTLNQLIKSQLLYR